jgi:predicted DNA-binding transcriptional regulator AlpA
MDSEGNSRSAYSVDAFCADHGICRATFYNLENRGEGPRLMRVGGRTLISREAAADWRREREAAWLRERGTAELAHIEPHAEKGSARTAA